MEPLHEFSRYADDGFNPDAGIGIGPNGSLYGTTDFGGSGAGLGTVFELQPLTYVVCPTTVCYWSESQPHSFQGGTNDGNHPEYGTVIFDQAGNIYGTTLYGGENDNCDYSCGTAYEVTPSQSGWTEHLLHSFGSGSDGKAPAGGMIFDSAGNLYGAASGGGAAGHGTIFELTPSGDGTWSESILHNFTASSEGSGPQGTLIRDASGNLYGTTSAGGTNGGGTVFELGYSNGGWVLSTLYGFSACTPIAGVTTDFAGSLYGVCSAGGAYGYGLVFELTNSSGSWTLTDLHDFSGGSDGATPWASVVVFDSSGNLYGTAAYGGGGGCGDGCGTVWEISGLNRGR